MTVGSQYISSYELYFYVDSISLVKECLENLHRVSMVPIAASNIKYIETGKPNNDNLLGVYYILTLEFESDKDCNMFQEDARCIEMYHRYNQ